jgi:hypothetical protein
MLDCAPREGGTEGERTAELAGLLRELLDASESPD